MNGFAPSWHDAVGAVGVALILIPYFLVQTGRLGVKRPAYSLMNGLGAALILVSLINDFNLSAAIIESFWLLISVVGLVRQVRARSKAAALSD